MTSIWRLVKPIAVAATVAAGTAAVVATVKRADDDIDQSETGVLDAAGVRRLYDRVAPFYDIAAAPYVLIGGRRLAHRAVEELHLDAGDTVIDLGTGTGWNLPHLSAAVGPTGQVIGVDISPGMLTRARRQLERHRISNVELVEHDIATYQPLREPDAVISTFAIEMLPDYHQVIGKYVKALAPAGRIATTGLRNPDRWPEWLIRVGSAMNRIFGVSDAYRNHRPWEAVQANTDEAIYVERLAGATYLAVGTRPEPKSTTGQIRP